MQDGLFKTLFRSFFRWFGAVAGFLAAIILIFSLSFVSETVDGEPTIQYDYTAQICADGNGIRKDFSSSLPIILKLNVQGVIGTEQLNRHTVSTELLESRERYFKDGKVKGILLNIDSPGGTVTDANGIYEAIKTYKERYKVPVIAYTDGLCASGGMYIACAADKIYANDTCLVGSIGVLFPSMFNFTKLMDKVGVESLTLTAGKGKDDLNPFRPWTPEEKARYQALTDYTYNQFVHIVTSNRPGVDKDKLVKEYGAEIFPAATAAEYHLIDEAGYTLEKALSVLAKELKIEDDQYLVVELKGKTWLNTLLEGKAELNLLKGEVKHRLELSPFLDPKIMNQPLYLYRQE